MADDLFLQVDGARRHDHAFLVLHGPQRGGQQVGHGLADAGGRFNDGDAVLIKCARYQLGHGGLLGAQFKAGDAPGQGAVRTESAHQVARVEGNRFLREKRLDHDIDARGLVVHDIDAMAVSAVDLGQLEVGVARLEVARGMVVQHHLAQVQLGEQGGHGGGVAPGQRTRLADQARLIEQPGKKHLAPRRLADMPLELVGRGPGDSVQNGFAVAHALYCLRGLCLKCYWTESIPPSIGTISS